MSARELIDAFDFSYRGGNDVRFENAYHIAMNIYLVSAGLRHAFILTRGEFKRESVFHEVVEKISHYLKPTHLDDVTVVFWRDDDRDTARLIIDVITLRREFDETGDPGVQHRAEVALGRLLGYPCAGQLDGGYRVSLRVRDGADVITNLCDDEDSYLEASIRFDEMKEELEEFFGEVRRFRRTGLFLLRGNPLSR